ncbi:hypothetical protein [Microbacterium sp. 10M-3C3]|uniref:hypothetical protein n=1 Tax=Microbacterium sp. 10M-3C3 TaxID=2483401 RepID=UPI000F6315DD|nr:hypothetical protein [Microbacterium sp. 10M-3C3]
MPAVPLLPLRRLLVTLAIAVVAMTTLIVVGAPTRAQAASQGTGFGTWAPLSAYGWHGSMLVDGVHTYCILPGLPAPTGPSTDHGVRPDAGGLSPQQLVGINRIVTAYGQTGDPVQAAAVGWAVKAVADRTTTLHGWGYTGDSLTGAIEWVFSRFAPEHAGAVAQRAEAYYTEALATPVPGADGGIALTTDAGDPRRGTVQLSGGAGTVAAVSLVNATFVEGGGTTRDGVAPGTSLDIVAAPPTEDGAPYAVIARATYTAQFAPAVRYVTTDGQQSTAGPGGGVSYTVEATDAAPRPVVFSPGITTQVPAPEVEQGPFVDDVTLAPVEGVWPRRGDGSFVPIRATAVVYRTEAAPAGPAVPADAEPVGELALTADPARGAGTYRVTSDWELPGPGYYTAVWRIAATEQDPAVAVHLERDYVWAEEFATPSQIVRVPAPPAPPTPTVPETPRALAATGLSGDLAPRVAAAGCAAAILGAGLLAHLARRRRTT